MLRLLRQALELIFFTSLINSETNITTTVKPLDSGNFGDPYIPLITKSILNLRTSDYLSDWIRVYAIAWVRSTKLSAVGKFPSTKSSTIEWLYCIFISFFLLNVIFEFIPYLNIFTNIIPNIVSIPTLLLITK